MKLLQLSKQKFEKVKAAFGQARSSILLAEIMIKAEQKKLDRSFFKLSLEDLINGIDFSLKVLDSKEF